MSAGSNVVFSFVLRKNRDNEFAVKKEHGFINVHTSDDEVLAYIDDNDSFWICRGKEKQPLRILDDTENKSDKSV